MQHVSKILWTILIFFLRCNASDCSSSALFVVGGTVILVMYIELG